MSVFAVFLSQDHTREGGEKWTEEYPMWQSEVLAGGPG